MTYCEWFQFVKTLSAPPKLALNGVGGKSALRISSVLERGGTCIVYGTLYHDISIYVKI